MLDGYCLGNLNRDSFADLDRKRKELGFLEESMIPEPECLECGWRMLCRGGCRRDRDYFERGLGKNYYCSAYKSFFEYAYPRLCEVYRLVMKSIR